MRKIVDYIIVAADTDRELQDLVTENIKDWCWQPIGGIHTHLWHTEEGNNFEFYQAMVKYEKDS